MGTGASRQAVPMYIGAMPAESAPVALTSGPLVEGCVFKRNVDWKP